MIHTRSSGRRLAVALCALTLVAACGSDDDTSSSDTVSTQPDTDTLSTQPVTEPDVTEPDVTEPDVTEPVDTEPADTTDSGDGPGRDGVVETFMQSGLNEEAANCVADKIEDEYGPDVFSQTEAPADLQARSQEFGLQCAQAAVSVPANPQGGRDGFIEIAMSGGLNEETATCVADRIEEEYGPDIFDATELPPDFPTAIQGFGESCAADQAGL